MSLAEQSYCERARMSRDRTAAEVVEDILYKPKRDLANLEMQLKTLVETAKIEGRNEVRAPIKTTVVDALASAMRQWEFASNRVEDCAQDLSEFVLTWLMYAKGNSDAG